MQTEIEGIAIEMNINTWDNGDNNIKLYETELIWALYTEILHLTLHLGS